VLLVRVGLASAEAVTARVADFDVVLGITDTPVLVQPMLDGIEVALGVVRDASFGPMVMVATGGVDIDHVVYAAVLVLLAALGAGHTLGLGARWESLPVVRRSPWLR
jgi:hypothetical protein